MGAKIELETWGIKKRLTDQQRDYGAIIEYVIYN
jgi:hypothetical protein